MLINGFAYTVNESEECQLRRNRLAEMNALHFGQYVNIESYNVLYAKHTYRGTVDPSFSADFSPKDLLIWLDGDPLAPFGGTIDYDSSTGRFSATVYTD